MKRFLLFAWCIFCLFAFFGCASANNQPTEEQVKPALNAADLAAKEEFKRKADELLGSLSRIQYLVTIKAHLGDLRQMVESFPGKNAPVAKLKEWYDEYIPELEKFVSDMQSSLDYNGSWRIPE